MHVIPYTGSDAWVENTILKIKKCLDSNEIPKMGDGCEHCMWFNARTELEGGITAPPAAMKKKPKKLAKSVGSPLF